MGRMTDERRWFLVLGEGENEVKVGQEKDLFASRLDGNHKKNCSKQINLFPNERTNDADGWRGGRTRGNRIPPGGGDGPSVKPMSSDRRDNQRSSGFFFFSIG